MEISKIALTVDYMDDNNFIFILKKEDFFLLLENTDYIILGKRQYPEEKK